MRSSRRRYCGTVQHPRAVARFRALDQQIEVEIVDGGHDRLLAVVIRQDQSNSKTPSYRFRHLHHFPVCKPSKRFADQTRLADGQDLLTLDVRIHVEPIGL